MQAKPTLTKAATTAFGMASIGLVIPTAVAGDPAPIGGLDVLSNRFQDTPSPEVIRARFFHPNEAAGAHCHLAFVGRAFAPRAELSATPSDEPVTGRGRSHANRPAALGDGFLYSIPRWSGR